jgi:soluble lytic murein transglycosylase
LKPSNRGLIFKSILFCELLLIFSFIAAFSILKAINLSGQENFRASDRLLFPGREHWTRNYKILKQFLHEDSVPIPPESSDRPEILKKKRLQNLQSALKEAGSHMLTSDYLKLQIAELFLEEKKYTEFSRLVFSLKNSFSFLEQKKNRLILHLLYTQKKYNRFIEQFNNRPSRDSEINILLIDCLIKSNQTNKGLELFKKIFKNSRVSVLNKILTPSTVKYLLSKLDTSYWLEKWSHQARENDFSYFFQEKKFARSAELQALFYAEYYYARQRFRQARQALTRVKSKLFSDMKNRLVLKMNVRENQVNGPEIMDQLKKLQGDRRLYADLLFNTANILFTGEKTDLALQFYHRYLQTNQDHHNPDYWKTLWIMAWIKYRRNQKDQALPYFKKGGESPILPYKIANLYWAGQLEKRIEPALEKYPFTYYYTKINRTANTVSAGALEDFTGLINEKSTSIFENIIRTLGFLIRHRFVRESHLFIRLAKSEPKLSAADINMLKIIESIIYLRQNKFYQAFVGFRNNFDCYQCIYLPAFLSQIYLPVRFEQEIKKYSRSNDIDPYLVLAIIREESFFKTDAVSRARAYGLMQILFNTAREVAARNGERLKKNALFNPDTNIRLGIKYLKFLMEKYGGGLHLALAAYNAGDFRVDRWLEQAGPISDDEFIEMIPFSETRIYVKNIIRNYFFYRFYHNKNSL